MSKKQKDTKKKKKRSQAPIALVYFLSLSICLLVVGGVVLTLFQKYNFLDLGKTDATAYDGYTSRDCTTVLFVRINSKNALQDMMIMRIDPTKDKLYLVPITSYVYDEQKGRTLKQSLEADGISGLVESTQRCLGVSIDKYMTVSNGAFENVCDLLGGYSYTPSEDLYYLSGDEDTEKNDVTLKKGSTQTLMGHQIRLVMTYPVFSEGRQGNVKFMAEALEAMFKNAFALPDTTKGNLDTLYSLASKKSDTDITDRDFSKIRKVVSDMLSRGVAPVITYTPVGSWNEDETQFIVAETFREDLGEQFVADVIYKEDSST